MKKLRIKLTEKTLELLKKYDDQIAKETKETQEFVKTKTQMVQTLQQMKVSLLTGIIAQSNMDSSLNWKLEGEELVEQTKEELDALAQDPNNLVLPIEDKKPKMTVTKQVNE